MRMASNACSLGFSVDVEGEHSSEELNVRGELACSQGNQDRSSHPFHVYDHRVLVAVDHVLQQFGFVDYVRRVVHVSQYYSLKFARGGSMSVDFYLLGVAYDLLDLDVPACSLRVVRANGDCVACAVYI